MGHHPPPRVEEGYDPDVGCRLTHEAEGRLDEAADPHNGNVEAELGRQMG